MNNCRNNRCAPCDDTVECKKPSSSIIYDGCDIPEWGVRHGDNLNSVIEAAGRAFKLLRENASPVYVEYFKNPLSVHLSRRPIEVMMVAYCGGVVPSKYWSAMGQDIQFSGEICTDQADEVIVVYKAPADNQFNPNCRV